jgi:hypothetical protein
VPQVASAPEPDSHDVNDLTTDPGQLGQERQGEEQQGGEQTLVENHAPETRFDPLSSRLELTTREMTGSLVVSPFPLTHDSLAIKKI